MRRLTACAAALAFGASMAGAATVDALGRVAPLDAAPQLTQSVLGIDSVKSAGGISSLSSVSFGNFDIVVNFTGGLTASQQAAFSTAETFWESRITGYRTSGLAAAVPNLTIDASGVDIDGPGSILGQAGATTFSAEGAFGSAFAVSNTGIMQFDTADLDAMETAGRLGEVILHEMAHVMGFTDFFWDWAGATDGSGSDATYTGAVGLTTYQSEFDPLATFVPVEEDFGQGTAFAHWDEALFGNPGASPAASTGNRELMTGFLDSPTFLSDTTLGSFEDIGYATILSQSGPQPEGPGVVPLPATSLLLLSGLVGLGVAGRRRFV